MTARHDCLGMAYGGLRCFRPATVERDGKWWCWQHDPEHIKAEAIKRMTAWQAEQDRLDALYIRNTRLGALVTEELAMLLDRLVDMAVRIASETEAQYGIDDSLAVRQSKQCRAGRTLAASIREVLDEH